MVLGDTLPEAGCRANERENPGGRVAIPFNFIKYQRNPPTGTLTLNDPERGNRITPELAAELTHVCRMVGEDPEIHLLVVTGSGAVFSTGRAEVPEEIRQATLTERAAWLEGIQVSRFVSGLPIPTLVVINGDAMDHGLELALAGDIRVAARQSRLGITDLARGSFPWDGGTQRLPRLVGPAWARDLLLTSRVIEADEALSLGMVNRVVDHEDLSETVRQMSDEITAAGPIAARYAKEAVEGGLELPLSQGLRLETDLNIILQSTADRAEGLRSFTERRGPRFTGT